MRGGLLEESTGDVAVDVDVAGWVGRRGKVAGAAEHGEHDGEGVGGVVEGDMEDGAAVDERVDSSVVVLTWIDWLKNVHFRGVGKGGR